MRSLAADFPHGRDADEAAAAALPPSLYRFITQSTRHHQLWVCALTLAIVPVSMLPLEAQRRLVNEAIGGFDPSLLAWLGMSYFAAILVQGGLKYALNLRRGRIVEDVARELRHRIHATAAVTAAPDNRHVPEQGALVAMIAAESEDVAGFVAESISTPLLQGGTIVAVLGYLIWVQPLIASLAIVLYLPELIIVPWRQRTINRLGRVHTRTVRKLGNLVFAEGLGIGRLGPHGFDHQVDRAYAARMVIYRIKYSLTLLGNLLDALGPLAVLVVGGWLVIQGQTTVGSLMVFITGFQKVGDPLDQLMTFYRTAQNAHVKYGLLASWIAGHRGTTSHL
jgi:ABC-type bacteriocin/lantibiotic exporter with double-glycine peptidase domain